MPARDPLRGQTVLVTRSRKQAAELTALLEAAGARVVRFPTIEVVPPADPERLEQALGELGRYQWLVLTSPNGVAAVRQVMERRGLDASALAGVRVAAVGPGTARALKAWGVEPDLVPERFETAYLADALVQRGVRGAEVLVARSLLGSPLLVERLREAGARVTEVEAYRVDVASAEGDLTPEKVRDALDRGTINWVALTSPSTASGLIQRLGGWERRWSARTRVACIGPVTAQRCWELGLPVDLESPVSSLQGLVDALVEACGKGEGRRSEW